RAGTARQGADDRLRSGFHLCWPAARSAEGRSLIFSLPVLNLVVLGLVTLSRVVELPIARANTRRLIAAGAHEVAAGHYPLIVAVHVAWLAALWWLAPDQPINLLLLALFGLVEIARIWVLQTLGPRWTTRIIVMPGEMLVRRGPYKFINHPNYAVVVAEIALLPLV